MYQYRQIIIQMREGQSDRSLSRSGIIGRTKAGVIRKVAQTQGWLEPAHAVPDEQTLAQHFNQHPVIQANVSQAAGYKQVIEAWVSEGIQANIIHRTLVEQHGYKGSYDSVQRYVKKIKANLSFTPTVPLHFKIGEAAQVDFGQGPNLPDSAIGKEVKTWFFVMTLCWSRHQYVELVTDQSIETWLNCHRRSFEWFGGIPKKIIIDNPKCAITKACYYEPTLQRSYADYAQQWGFMVSPCPVREPKKKGRVESGVKYVKKNFASLRQFRNLADANAQLKEWIMTTAGNRIHGSTFKQPLAQFCEFEKTQLIPLPSTIPELVRWEKVLVYNHCHVRFEHNFYSVPHTYVKRTLWLSVNEATIKLYDDHTLLAVHARCFGKGEYVTIIEHLPPNARYYLVRDPQWCKDKAKAIGHFCHQVVTHLLSDKTVDYIRAAQGILQLSEHYSPTRLEKACQRAVYFNSCRYKSIKAILEKGLDNEVLQQDADFDALASVYCGHSKFMSSQTNH